MPKATRLNDNNTGHDACPPRPLITGSKNVFINGLPAGRVSDKYATHSCIEHSPHQDFISEGSSSVFINGLSAGRVGDAVLIGGNVLEGSNNVFIGG